MKRFPSRCASAIHIVRPCAVQSRHTAPTPSGFAEIVGDGFPLFHGGGIVALLFSTRQCQNATSCLPSRTRSLRASDVIPHSAVLVRTSLTPRKSVFRQFYSLYFDFRNLEPILESDTAASGFCSHILTLRWRACFNPCIQPYVRNAAAQQALITVSLAGLLDSKP